MPHIGQTILGNFPENPLKFCWIPPSGWTVGLRLAVDSGSNNLLGEFPEQVRASGLRPVGDRKVEKTI